MIDKSGPAWRGADFEDLAEYVREYSAANGYRAARVVQSRCGCDATTLALQVDQEVECALRRCACGTSVPIADSEQVVDEADLSYGACPCGGETFEVAVGFSFRDDGDVRWVTVGARCVACGLLGVYADWKVDYSPTTDLLDAV